MHRNIFNHNSGIYLNYGYLTLPINLSIISKIKIDSETYFAKSSFHVSLIYLGELAESDQKKLLIFAQKYNVFITGITNNYRLVKQGDKQSIIVRIRLQGLKKLISNINSYFGYNFVYPPTHITLFNLKGQYGIGINSRTEYNEITSQINRKYLQKITKSFKLIN